MRYTTFHTDKAVITISIFNVKGSRTQVHAIVRSRIPDSSFAAQLRGITEASEAITAEIEALTGVRVSPVFRRYYLSDPANQAEHIRHGHDCAESIAGQSPLDHTKVAQWIWLQEDGKCHRCNDGLWGNRHGQLWQGDPEFNLSGNAADLTEKALERMSQSLLCAGGRLSDHCLRTWFMVRDIDVNYPGVVAARNKVFAKSGLTTESHFIASTGIGAYHRDPNQTVSFNAFADLTLSSADITYLKGRSHLNPTAEYGVAFERATATDYPCHREVLVSGTASIDSKGMIVAPGDILAQTERMTENIEVLLSEGGCGFSDLAHLIVYLRDISDYKAVDNYFASRLPDVPRLIVHAPVCRPGWLVEAECMAMKAR